MFDETNSKVEPERRINLENRSIKMMPSEEHGGRANGNLKREKSTADRCVPEEILPHTAKGVPTGLLQQKRMVKSGKRPLPHPQACDRREG